METTDGNLDSSTATSVGVKPRSEDTRATDFTRDATLGGRAISVTMVTPALAKYRLPVFKELARRPGIDLRVVYGSVKDLPNVAPEGFESIPMKLHERRIGGVLVSMHAAEWRYCGGRDSDVVSLRWSPRSITLLPALLRAKASGVPTILWGHGFSKNRHGKKIRMRAWYGKHASALVFYEPTTRDAYIRAGWDPKRLFVALNSLDHTEIESARQWWLDRPEELARFRREQGIDGGPMALFVSRLQPERRTELLIQATAQLSKELPDLKTVIIGNGDAERERLKAIAQELGGASRIRFHEGIYDEMSLAPWFLSARVMCYPSHMGLSLLHSLWYGVPVITSGRLDIQGPEVVALENGVNGFAYEHGSLESLVDSLRKVLTDNALRESMSAAARRTVEGRFTIPRMVDGLEAAIRYAYNTRAPQTTG